MALVKTLLLVPEQDNRGRRFPRALWRELEDRLLALGGFSLREGIVGAWHADGRVYRDVSGEYTVSLRTWRALPSWSVLVEWALEAFNQEALYIEVAGLPEILQHIEPEPLI